MSRFQFHQPFYVDKQRYSIAAYHPTKPSTLGKIFAISNSTRIFPIGASSPINNDISGSSSNSNSATSPTSSSKSSVQPVIIPTPFPSLMIKEKGKAKESVFVSGYVDLLHLLPIRAVVVCTFFVHLMVSFEVLTDFIACTLH